MTQTLKSAAAEATAAPPVATVTLQAPLRGWVMPLSEVPDPVFSSCILGDGVAIDPLDSVLRAPANAQVVTVHRAHHALTLRLANGAEVLLHVGLDTVNLRGEGFTVHVVDGQAVKVGDPLISFDLDLLAHHAPSLVIPIILTNGDGYVIRPTETGREVALGDFLIAITAADSPSTAAPAVPPVTGPEIRLDVTLRDRNGIHARPAGLVADCARHFTAEVTILAKGRRANARGAVGLMQLDAQFGDILTIVARGPDAEAAADAVAALINAGLDDEVAATPAPATGPVPPAPTLVAARETTPFADGEEVKIAGVRAVGGIAAGHAFRLIAESLNVVEAARDIDAELAALRRALDRAAAQIRSDIAQAGDQNKQRVAILEAHLSFLDDPELAEAAELVVRQRKSAGFAWRTAITDQIAVLQGLGNARLAERAADLRDIERAVLLALAGRSEAAVALRADSILIADEVLPSQMAALDLTKVGGICMAGGGPTSHAAILAAAAGIPTLVAAGPNILRVGDGVPVILDADAALLHVNPPQQAIQDTVATLETRHHRRTSNLKDAQQECRMADGTRIEVVANLGSPDDVPGALANGAEGCGLLRSEFLFLGRQDAPDEDEQATQYQAIATALGGRPLIIRTLDAGADKDVPYVGLPHDENPALGVRGVRISRWRPELLRTQLRAILRVQPPGQCRIMVPMIAILDDLRLVRGILDEEMAALGRTDKVPLGIMIEVPAAAVMAELFAAEADFFSVGTNDLTQYTLAMDRGNPHLAKWLDGLHPAVLRLIATAALGARKHQRWIGVCGGVASVPLAAPVLIGLGVTELSASPAAIPDIKALVRTLTMGQCLDVAEQALKQESAAAVRQLLAKIWPHA
ncbi:MAG: phosphoenolpyruvate--protein phosphotransferase [Azospirillaceae bacterium]|nr:phosphoenolpyruvate--protein phosphotransferase [Azospirillaceae bacterium]